MATLRRSTETFQTRPLLIWHSYMQRFDSKENERGRQTPCVFYGECYWQSFTNYLNKHILHKRSKHYHKSCACLKYRSLILLLHNHNVQWTRALCSLTLYPPTMTRVKDGDRGHLRGKCVLANGAVLDLQARGNYSCMQKAPMTKYDQYQEHV